MTSFPNLENPLAEISALPRLVEVQVVHLTRFGIMVIGGTYVE